MKPDNFPTRPAHLWRHFYRITQIPRPSGQEAEVRQYVMDLADGHGYPWRMDGEGNLVVSVPASAGREQRPPVIVQNHLDMVTVKTAGSAHDFSRDPLSLAVDDGWLRAQSTTLGADNGLGCATALALMTDPQVVRPPLELLFTVDEETGLGGALNLDPALLTGTRMLNLDTEDWRELFVGCAGGGGWEFRRTFTPGPPPAGAGRWRITLGGLAGGHSGIQIHQQLGNAVKLLGQCLQGLEDVRLAGLDAGVAHNVIPREGFVEFTCGAGEEELVARLQQLKAQALGYLPGVDAGLEFDLQAANFDRVLGPGDSRAILDLLAAFPHGVQAYNLELAAELVDLSINLAIARLEEGELMLESSYRFFSEEQSLPLQQAVLALARAFDLRVSPVAGYPGWQPDLASPLLARARTLFEELFGETPAVKAIHAGLECGILKNKNPDLDILSFGPTIRGAHSPSERLQIDTVEPFWLFLTELLAQM